MKVKLQSTAAGPNGVFRQGDTIDIPKEQAEELIRTGQAESLKEARSRDKATTAVDTQAPVA